MTANPDDLLGTASAPLGPASTSSVPRTLREWLARVSLNDWIVLAYLGLLNVAVMTSNGSGPARDRAWFHVAMLLIVFSTVVLGLIRGGVLTHPFFCPLAFRLSHYGCIQLTYFFMRGLLPIVNPGSWNGSYGPATRSSTDSSRPTPCSRRSGPRSAPR